MMKEEKQVNKEIIGELHQLEMELIHLLRTEYRFGRVEIEMHNGLPQQIFKTIVRRKLGKS